MTRTEALEIIDRCHGWNSSQRSWSLASGGPRQPEDDVFDARRNALVEAWLSLNTEPLVIQRAIQLLDLLQSKPHPSTETHNALAELRRCLKAVAPQTPIKE